MATVGDAEAALAQAIESIFYPNGLTQGSLTGLVVNIFRGWPTTSQLTQDRAADAVDISITAVVESFRNSTRWGVQTYILPAASSLSVSVQDNSATFTGSGAAGVLAGVLAAQIPYVYAVQGSDSAALVAAALGQLIRQNTICWVSGATLTVPAVTSLIARTTGSAAMLQEFGRQEQSFKISIWAGSPAERDALGAYVVQGMAPISFLTLSDGSAGRLRLERLEDLDSDQVASIYQRDIIYSIEYATIIATTAPEMLFGDLGYNGATRFV